MGIKKFFEVFDPSNEIKLEDLFGKTVAIDAYSEMYRSCLGMSGIHALTNEAGRSTVHIGPLQATMMNLYKSNVGQIWVFDTSKASLQSAKEKGYVDTDKLRETMRRFAVKDNARNKIAELTDNFDNDMVLNDDFIASMGNEEIQPATSIISEVRRLEKQAFSLPTYVVEDLIVMLNTLNIAWIEAPVGFQGEAVAASLADRGIVDAVISSDSDALVFGAPILYTRGKNGILYEYKLSDILEKIGPDATMDDLRRIAVVLGCDWCAGKKGIGAARILSVYKDVELTEEQLHGIEIFSREVPDIAYGDLHPIISKESTDTLINWLVLDQQFGRDRLTKLYDKYLIVATSLPKRRKKPSTVTSPTKKSPPSKKKAERIVKENTVFSRYAEARRNKKKHTTQEKDNLKNLQDEYS